MAGAGSEPAPYSFSNVMLIGAQSPEATMAAGFQVWKQKAHVVRASEKATMPLAPTLRKTPVFDEARRPVCDENGKQRLRREMVGTKPVSVFDASQVARGGEYVWGDLPGLGSGQGPVVLAAAPWLHPSRRVSSPPAAPCELYAEEQLEGRRHGRPARTLGQKLSQFALVRCGPSGSGDSRRG